MKVLVACEFSGVVREAFKNRGHDAWSCDVEDTEIPGNHIKDDVLNHLDDGWDLVIAHPPCTYLTAAGNKWFTAKYADRFPNRKQQREDAVAFFMKLAGALSPRIAIENPVGVMSSRWRKPDQIIQPYQFGVPVRKSTCLWLRGLPRLVCTRIVEPEIDRFSSGNCQSRWHTETGHIKDRRERMKARSRTFPAIAQAMAEQWG